MKEKALELLWAMILRIATHKILKKLSSIQLLQQLTATKWSLPSCHGRAVWTIFISTIPNATKHT